MAFVIKTDPDNTIIWVSGPHAPGTNCADLDDWTLATMVGGKGTVPANNGDTYCIKYQLNAPEGTWLTIKVECENGDQISQNSDETGSAGKVVGCWCFAVNCPEAG